MAPPFDRNGAAGLGLARRSGFAAIVAIIAIVVFSSSWFVVPPANVAFTRWLGGTVMQRQRLHLKVPFMETVDQLQVSQSVYSLPPMAGH
jgi:regulator of protease activity HflC (stomatin/prohibitin superfamily)